MGNLLRRLAALHAPFLIAAVVMLGAFEYLICAAVGSANVSGAIETLLDSLPPIVQSMVSTQLLGGLTLHGLVAFGWNHPIAHALGAAVAIVLGARAIAGEAEVGTIELVLGQPLSRASYFGAYVILALGTLAVACAAGLAGTLIGQRVFGLEPFAAAAPLRLGANYFALQGAWFGVALLLSAVAREGGRAASLAFMIALASYLAQVIGAMWDRAAFALPWTLHHYYSPQAILVEGASVARPIAVLLAVLAASLALAWLRFRRRDLP